MTRTLLAVLAALALLASGCADGWEAYDGRLFAYDNDGKVDTRLGVEACASRGLLYDGVRPTPFGDSDGEMVEVICR